MNLHPKWTSQDLAALTALNAGMGGIRVLEVIEENHMTEQAPEDFTGGNDDGGWAEATGKDATFPETPQNPHNHVYTWSPKLPDGSMLVVRANTPADLVGAVQALAPLAAQLKAAWTAVVGQPAPAPAAPQGGFQPQQQFNQQPAQPFPNQPFPGQPAWQQAGAPQGQFGGGGQGGGQGSKPQPKPQPNGWYKTDKNTGPGADFWKSWREQNQQALKGKIQWGGGGTFWVAPDVAGMVHAAGFAVVAG